jgi:hypothetical protein
VGSRSSFEWWYFQEDWSSFEFSFWKAILFFISEPTLVSAVETVFHTT